MKITYTPGENGLVGRRFKVEIVGMEILESNHINRPMLAKVKIKYENGKTEWISGTKLFHSVDRRQRALVAKAV